MWWAAFAAATVLYLAYPRIDLVVSGIFYVPGRGFPAESAAWSRFIALWLVPGLAWTLGIGLVGALVWTWTRPSCAGRPRRVAVYLALSYLLGPGLVTNVLLKDHWGRARPLHVRAFGGPLLFTTPLHPASQCSSNCSFVSGHVSVPFCLMSFCFLIRDRRRRRWAMIGLGALGAMIGLERIAAGKHFLSDVLFSALFNTGIAWVLYVLIVDRVRAPEWAARARDPG